MVIIDISYADDFLRHDILISRLEMVGINGSALKWRNSYIINRSLSVKLCNLSSDPPSTPWYPTLFGPMPTSIIYIYHL